MSYLSIEPSEILSPDGSVQGADHLNIQPSGLLQNSLGLGAVLAHDVRIISSGVIQPVSLKIHFVRVQVPVHGTEGSEGIG